MAKLPEDIKLAIEGLRTIEEKFLTPLRRLQDVVRVCMESEQRVENAERKLEKVQQDLTEAQRVAAQQLERAEARLKATADQLATVQKQWEHEESSYKKRMADMERGLAELDATIKSRCIQRDEIAGQIASETQRLEELRERIRRAQTMEP